MSTPLMKQYNNIKERYKEYILFFRLGDFYEMFYEDAKIASSVLGITLTSRDKNKNIPMAGVPWHSSSGYIAKLIAKGYKVAMCEQTEDAVGGKIVNRDVTKIITPGTFSDSEYIDSKDNRYIVHFCYGFNGSALSYLDLTTGHFVTSEYKANSSKALNDIFRLSPKEIVLGTIKDNNILSKIEEYAKFNNTLISNYQIESKATEYLINFFNISSPDSFGLKDKKYSIVSSASLLKYVEDLQNCDSIKKIVYKDDDFLSMDYSSIKNLNIVHGESSLLSIIDKSKSAMGGRFLKKELLTPLLCKEKIEERYSDIEHFIDNPLIRVDISNFLKSVLDIERSYMRVLRSEANIRDLNVIKKSLKAILDIYNISNNYFTFDRSFLEEQYNYLNGAILESNATSIKEGDIINPQFNEELLELYNIRKDSKDFLLKLEIEERKKSGIKNLKVGYNKIFGYYIEITRSNLSSVPQEYIRKQTLANAERYITEELKEYEEKILSAKDKMNVLEYTIFNQICKQLSKHNKIFSKTFEEVSYLDFIIALSEVAINNNYVKPNLKLEGNIEIKGGRHPIVEKLVDNYVDNDLILKDSEIIILTGPNMSGKSTFMKSIALTTVLAQIGSFVPASEADIPIIDKLFTRIGANDDILSGQSTFMVEMTEVANIINNATSKSLIILDEVGRGTSTYDGISIAKSTTEYIHKKIKAKTIFATHYHELNELESELARVSNYRVEVQEDRDRVIFLNKIVKGNADKSYGIEVARLAGLPHEILNRSRDLLKHMLSSNIDKNIENENIFEENIEKIIIDKITELDIDNLTPNDLYREISEIKKILDKEKK